MRFPFGEQPDGRNVIGDIAEPFLQLLHGGINLIAQLRLEGGREQFDCVAERFGADAELVQSCDVVRAVSAAIQ